MIEVLDPGPLGTIQDLGRRGHAHLGVPRSGAVDERSMRAANRLVGNPEGAAALELTLGGAVLRFHHAACVALTGAPVPARIGRRTVPGEQRLHVRAGAELVLGAPVYGLRTYLAVRGGVDVTPVLGSRSTDTLSGLGPPRLARGTLLGVGAAPLERFTGPDGPGWTGVPGGVPTTAEPVLRVRPGPRDDAFVPGAFGLLTSAVWEVTPQTDRVGVRLAGPPLRHLSEATLPSEGMVRGAVQVPPSGAPIVFLSDHPPTGGYPVLAVVVAADLGLLAQSPPGTVLRMRPDRPRRYANGTRPP